MFGDNPIRPVIVKKDAARPVYEVQEIFYTLQGEGPFAGRPAVFVRLAGCNLRCDFCDTDFESSYRTRALPMSIPEILDAVAQLWPAKLIEDEWSRGPCLVVLTGGEPLRQPISDLIMALGQREGVGYDVQVETSGLGGPIDERAFLEAFWVVSPKTSHVRAVFADPDAGDVWFKYVVSVGNSSCLDGLPYLGIQKGTKTHGAGTPVEPMIFRPPQTARIYVSPMDEHDEEKNKQNRRHAAGVAMKYGYHLTLQMHKLVDLP